jgi:hypothetical protein
MKPQIIEIRGCRFGKHGIRKDGKYYKCSYSHSALIDGKEAITIYGDRTTGRLPAVLNPENDTDLMTDYFEGDRARFYAGTPEFEALLPLIQAQKAVAA